MSQNDESELSRIENEIENHIGCRIRFFLNGKNYLGRIEACQMDSTQSDIIIWVTPEDTTLCTPWPRVKLAPSNVVEIIDNIFGFKVPATKTC